MKRPGGLTPPPTPDPAEPRISVTAESAKADPVASNSDDQPATQRSRWGRRAQKSPAPDLDATEDFSAVSDALVREPIDITAEIERLSANRFAEEDARAESERAAAEHAALDGATKPERDAETDLKEAVRARKKFQKAEARRFTYRSRARRRNWIIAVASTLALVALVLVVAYSPLLSVRTITVDGASRIDPAVIEEALEGQLDRPLALIDYQELERALEEFPAIESYVTESRPPSTLSIRIVERTPVANIETNGSFTLVDAAGVTLETGATAFGGFPVVDTKTTKVPGPGFEALGLVLRSLDPAMIASLATVAAPTPDSVTLTFIDNDRVVVWGSAEDSTLKAQILAKIVAQPAFADAREIDVSSPESPVVR